MLVKINELTSGMEFTGFYLLKSAMVKQTNDNKSYLDMVIGDATGEMPLKFWDISDADKEAYVTGSIIKLKGIVSTYRDKLQAKVLKIRLATKEDGYQIADFVKSAPVPAADLIHVIEQTIEQMRNEKIRNIVNFCVNRVKQQLWSFPAAKSMHHSYYSGLAYHMVRMLEIGDFIIRQRPFLQADLLRAGILLHDLGKVLEFEGGEHGICTNYTLAGQLLGHISMINTWVHEAAGHFGIDTQDHAVVGLQHMVLSHHGKLEYGSPVLPQLPEAIALHYIDNLDAKLQAVEDALDGSKDDCVTGIRAIDSGRVFRLNL